MIGWRAQRKEGHKEKKVRGKSKTEEDKESKNSTQSYGEEETVSWKEDKILLFFRKA